MPLASDALPVLVICDWSAFTLNCLSGGKTRDDDLKAIAAADTLVRAAARGSQSPPRDGFANGGGWRRRRALATLACGDARPRACERARCVRSRPS